MNCNFAFYSTIRAKRRFCRPEKVGKVARIGGWGGVWVIRAMPELKCVFGFDVFPYVKHMVRAGRGDSAATAQY